MTHPPFSPANRAGDANGSAGLVARFGSAKRPGQPASRLRPPDVSDDTVAALGTLSEALEVVEQARGQLYGFHRLCGTADLTLQRAVQQLRDAGHQALAAEIEETLVGRDLFEGQWSFQLVEAYDRCYWRVFREADAYARRTLAGCAPHLYEAEMKDREQHRD